MIFLVNEVELGYGLWWEMRGIPCSVMPEISPDLNINEGVVVRDGSAVWYEPRSLMLRTPSIVTKGGWLSLALT